MSMERYRDTILIVSFLTWCVLLTFPILAVVKDEVGVGVGPVPIYQMLGAAQFLAIAALVCRYGDLGGRYDIFQTSIIIITYLSLGLQLHDDPALIAIGIAYTIALLGTILALSLISTMPTDAVAKCLGRAAVVLVAFGISAVMSFGWPQGRHLGPIHPNSFGSAMLVAFIFSQFSGGTLFLLVRIACFVLAASVSSRFAIIGCVLALVVFELASNPFNLKLVLLAVLAAACFVLFNDQIAAIFALDDPDRNLGSGFTGRDERWSSSLEAMADNPFGMGFKRPPLEAWGHNGYLKIFVEFGIVGGGLVIAAVVSIVVRALFEAIAGFREDASLRRAASARAAGLVALTFATFFQPQLFNLGDMHGLSFMLLLFWRGQASARQPLLRLQEAQVDYGPARARFLPSGHQQRFRSPNRSS
jgi:O-antigen ligase